jgi:hypothetical protein
VHLVAASGELAGTLDMVSIFQSDDIQHHPSSPPINLPITASSHVLGGVSIVCENNMMKLVFITVTILELPRTMWYPKYSGLVPPSI